MGETSRKFRRVIISDSDSDDAETSSRSSSSKASLRVPTATNSNSHQKRPSTPQKATRTRTPPPANIFRCILCQKAFTSFVKLQQHIQSSSHSGDVRIFCCLVCKQGFTNGDDYESHPCQSKCTRISVSQLSPIRQSIYSICCGTKVLLPSELRSPSSLCLDL